MENPLLPLLSHSRVQPFPSHCSQPGVGVPCHQWLPPSPHWVGVKTKRHPGTRQGAAPEWEYQRSIHVSVPWAIPLIPHNVTPAQEVSPERSLECHRSQSTLLIPQCFPGGG